MEEASLKLDMKNIWTNQELAYQNVISKNVQVTIKNLNQTFQEFLEEIVLGDYTLLGPFFYSINNLPLDGTLNITMYMPIVEKTCRLADVDFQSYFYLERLMKTVVQKDFEQYVEKKYADLLKALEVYHFEQNTPFFHVLPTNKAHPVSIYLGYK